MQLRPGHGAAKHSRELEPTLRPCQAQSLALWFGLQRVKHIRSNCLLRRQKSALTSNIETPRDTSEEFPLAGVCGKPYIKCQGQPVCFPRASDWESSSTFLALHFREEAMWTHIKWCLYGGKASKSFPLSPCTASSFSSGQTTLEKL